MSSDDEKSGIVRNLKRVKRLSENFRKLHLAPGRKPLVLLRKPGPERGPIELPDDPRFNALAKEAGELLAEIPEHWRYGVWSVTMDESDPAKRWGAALFGYTIFGLMKIDGNADASDHTGRINDGALASALACDVILKSSNRPHWGNGTFAATLEFTKVQIDELLEESRLDPFPDLAVLYMLGHQSFEAACDIVKLTRNPLHLTPEQFVYRQARLDELMKHIKSIENIEWPESPGMMFGSDSSDSALDVAIKFADAILSTTKVACSLAGIQFGRSIPDLQVKSSKPDSKVVAWHNETIREINSNFYVFPILPAWPIHEIISNEGRIQSLIGSEYRRATERANSMAVKPPLKLDPEDIFVIKAADRWKIIAQSEIDEIGGWRDVDPKDRWKRYWVDRVPKMSGSFFSDTQTLIGACVQRFPKLDPTPISAFYKAVWHWYEDKNADNIPANSVLYSTAEEAVIVINVILNALHPQLARKPVVSAATERNPEWKATEKRIKEHFALAMPKLRAGAEAAHQMEKSLFQFRTPEKMPIDTVRVQDALSSRDEWITIASAEALTAINRGTISRAATSGCIIDNNKNGKARRISLKSFWKWARDRKNLDASESDAQVERKLQDNGL